MRLLIAVPFVFSALSLHAQDAGQMAAQQATMQAQQMAIQQAQQANQQAMQQAQQASQQATQDAQQASTNAAAAPGSIAAAKPRFSIAPGTYPSTITLRMKDPTRGSTIYYTTDGWTPTTLSQRYSGPITISATTNIQAIAVAPNYARSPIVEAEYDIAGTAPAAISATFPANAPGSPLLMPGTELPLVFTAPVTSRGLQVGDKLPIALAQNLIVGGRVLARKSTPVLATVTQVDKGGRMGFPGTISFEVHSLVLNDGTTLALSGTETKEGESRVAKADAAFIVPLGGLLVRGGDALISSGTPLTARVVNIDSSAVAKVNAVSNPSQP